MNISAFWPQGNTVLVAATSSTSVAPTQISTGGNVPAAMLSNPSSVSIYVALGSSTVSAAQPTTAAPAAGLCVPAGNRFPVCISNSTANNWLSAVTSAGTAPPGLFVTPGSLP